MNKYFCPVPWIHTSMDSTGDLRICCICKYGSASMLKKEDGTSYNAKNDKIPRNHKLYKEMRSLMLKGERHKLCRHCKELEDIKLESNRQGYNNRYSEYYDNIIKYTDEDGTINESKIPLVYYDLRLGNKCNCKCIICDKVNSSMWGSVTNWTDISLDTPYLNELIKNSKNIKNIYFTGGEPTINEHHWKLLDILLENSSTNIELDYNTNGVFLTEDMFKIWRQFKSTGIGFSIDGINETFEKIRSPAKWKTIEKNLKLFDKNGSETIFGIIAATISSINILNIIDLFKWCHTQKFKWIAKEFHFNILHTPTEMNIVNINSVEKERIKKEYEKFYIWIDKNCLPSNVGRIKKGFKGIINALGE